MNSASFASEIYKRSTRRYRAKIPQWVRGPKHVVKNGKTPVLSAEEARGLLDRIDISTMAGLRDRALIGVLVFSFARITAVVSKRAADYYTQGRRSFFRLHEKWGRYNVVLAHHLVQEYVDAYLEAAEFGENRRRPLFRRCAVGRQDRLEDHAMSWATAHRMIKRRARQAGLPAEICAHSFRGTGITEYLRNGGISRSRRGSPGTSRREPRSSTTVFRTRSRSTRSSGFTFRCVADAMNRNGGGDMPVVLRLGGFRFFFYSNERHPLEPAYIHVRFGQEEAKFWLRPGVVQTYNHGYDARTINRMQRLVDAQRGQLEEAWNECLS